MCRVETNYELPIKVRYDVYDGGYDISSASLYGVDLTAKQLEKFIEDYGMNHLVYLCADHQKDMANNMLISSRKWFGCNYHKEKKNEGSLSSLCDGKGKRKSGKGNQTQS